MESRETGALPLSPDLLRVHLPREETVTEVSRMEHRCFRPPPICCLQMADSQSSFPFHLIPFCGNTISTQSFARVCMCLFLSLRERWMDGEGELVFSKRVIRGLKFGGERWPRARSITAGNCYLAGINVDLWCLLI